MKDFLTRNLVTILCAVCLVNVLGAFFIVGKMTATDLTDEQNAYCKAVQEQTYPDYKKTFEKSCKEWLTEQNKSVN
jgi:formate/nitrite transporter FocA (FNT family)